MKPGLLLSVLFASCLLAACGDDPEGSASGRFVYYVSDDGSGTTAFHRYLIDSDRYEPQTQDPVVWISDVAENGRVLYMTRHGSLSRLHGRCEGGSIIPVPLPVAAQPGEEYVFADAPAVISHEGHHAAYIAFRQPVGSTDSSEWKPELCVFDCGAWQMRQFALDAFLGNIFTQQQVDFTWENIVPRWLGISSNGDAVFLYLDVFGIDSARHERRHFVLLSWHDGNLRLLRHDELLRGAAALPVTIFDPAKAEVFVRYSDENVVIDCRSGTERAADPALNRYPYRPATCSQRGEFVMRNDNYFLTLRRLSDGYRTVVVEGINTLQVSYPELRSMSGPHSEDAWCSVSPDGEWIAFVASHELDDGLYIIRRDGSQLRRIARGKFDVPPVVSDVVPY
jgi:hypothetical protein